MKLFQLKIHTAKKQLMQIISSPSEYKYRKVSTQEMSASESVDEIELNVIDNKPSVASLSECYQQDEIEIIQPHRYKDECGYHGYMYLAIVCCVIILFLCLQIYRTRPS
mmetsp:Transcript_10557/g.15866  ORF Transcript_10557/g.15866 Transcript_10557/m.15866 type:complete len:109 (-) Transcript_10557:41-367(-)